MELKFLRIVDPNAFESIPRYLLEQIKGYDDEKINRLYQYAPSILTIIGMDNGQFVRMPNPLVHIAILIDDKHIIKGFFWFQFDPIDKVTFIQEYSVDPEYQSMNGDLLNKAKDYLMSLPIGDEYKKTIRWATTRPHAFEKQGHKRSEKVLMEIDNE